MGVHRLECKHKVTVIGRLNWQDGEPGFDDRFDGVGRYARFADCDIAELARLCSNRMLVVARIARANRSCARLTLSSASAAVA
jgi:hypothetical protein